MYRPVLEPGRRRRRRGGLGGAAALLAAALLTAVFFAWNHFAGHESGAAKAAGSRHAAARASTTRPSSKKTRTPALVSSAAPVSHHRFHPRIRGAAAILVDARTGRVLWARREQVRRPIASTTKIMTAVLALERLGPRALVHVPHGVRRIEPFREGLRPGERVPAWKLLYSLMLFSGNDDAYALAVATSGSAGRFIALMNATAARLGLSKTHFASASGVVDRDNYSSAHDLAALARYAMRHPSFRRIVDTRIKRVRWARPTFAKVYVNKNALLATYRGADGIKTGWTSKAGHCLVASAHRSGVRLIAVVLGSSDAFTDARRLFNLGFRIAPTG
jgi:D-alanyl-D-alanine carboxypeptidase